MQKQKFVVRCSLFLFFIQISLPASAVNVQKNDEKSGQKKYLIVDVVGGFGNRIRALASAYVAAKYTSRELVVSWRPSDWSKRKEAGLSDLFANQFVEWSHIKSELPVSLETLRDPDRIHDRNHPERGKTNPKDVYRYYVQDRPWLYTNRDEIPFLDKREEKILYLDRIWFNFKLESMNFNEFKKHYRDFHAMLQPSEDIRTAIDFFKKKNSIGVSDHLIGVHIRTWSKNVGDNFSGSTSLEPFFEKMDMEMARHKNKNVRFLIATDNPKVMPSFIQRYGKDKIIKPDLKESPNRKTLQGNIDALVDWWCLTETQYIIGTFQSSFSDEASHLTKEKRKIEVGDLDFGFQIRLCFDQDGHFSYRTRRDKKTFDQSTPAPTS